MSSGLAIRGLDVAVQGHSLVRDAHLSARAGQLTALIGPNGAGKSTLMRAALGLQPIERGTVEFDGASLLTLPRRDRARVVAFVEQASTTEDQLSAREVVALGRIPFQSIWQAGTSQEDDAIVDDALATVAMSAMAHRLYGSLSGGEQQRIQLARALAQQPRLLVLDEPTSHLDIHAQLLVLDVLRRKAAAGMTVLLAIHDLTLAAAWCDSVVILHDGKTVAQGAPEDVLTPALLEPVYGVSVTAMRHPQTGRVVIAYDPRYSN